MRRKAMIVLLLLLIIPYAISILYSLPATDDFWMGIGVEKSSLLVDAFQKANSFWMGWGGMWFYEFFRTLLNPIVLFGATSSLLGVELLLFFFGFLVALWVMNHSFWNYIAGMDSKTLKLGSYFLLLAWLLNTEIWTEVFYWFAGSAYLWAMSFVMLTVALEFRYFQNDSRKNAIALSVIGAIACSFYSQAVFPCIVFLFLMGKELLGKRKVNLKKWIPFLCFLLGALSALVAPGNFARKTVDNGVKMQLFATVKNTLLMCVESLRTLFMNPVTIVILVLFVALGMLVLKETPNKYRCPAIPFFITLGILFVTYFPFALGYGRASYLPNRAAFVFHAFAIFLFAASALYFGGWLRYNKRIILTAKEVAGGILVLLLFVYTCYIPTEGYREIPYYVTVTQMGQARYANGAWKEVLSIIEASEEDVIEFANPEIKSALIKTPGITDDADDVNNKKVSDYYKKDAIRIKWYLP